MGTIPVAFRNVNYRIPTELWIPYGYPQEPPIVYVTATPEILIRPGRHVSGEGRIYHPYLARWSEAWGVGTMSLKTLWVKKANHELEIYCDRTAVDSV